MKNQLKILFVDDNPDDVKILLHQIKKEFVVVDRVVDDKNSFMLELATFGPDIIISDYSMPSFTGMDALKLKQKSFPYIPFILVTGSINEETAVECIKNGADDYILKNRLERLNSAITSAIEKRQTQLDKIEAEEKYKNVFENSLIGLYRTTPDGKIILANQTLVKMLGFDSFDELANRNLEVEGFEPNYPRSVFKDLMEKQERIIGLESAWTRKDGSTIYVRESTKAVKDGYGNIKYYDGVVEDVTERVIAQQKLEKQFSTLNSIINSPNDIIIFSLDRNYCYTSFNELHKKEMKKVWNADIEVGMNMLDLMTIPELRKLAKESMDRVFNGERIHEVQEQKNMGIFYEFNWNPIYDAHNNIIGLSVFIHDITDKKILELDIRKKTEQLETIFNTTYDGICVTDKDEKIVLVNPRFSELLGYENDELINKYFKELVDPNFYDLYIQKRSERKQGEKDTFEIQLLRNDGSQIWLLVSASPYFDDDGNFNGSFGMFTDISEIKKTETELRKFFTAVEQNSSDIMITDVDANIEYVNPRFTELTGYTKEEVIGRNPRFLKSGNKSKEEYEQMWNILTSGKSWHGEFLNKKKNGELYWESAIISPIVNEKGIITNYIAIKDDITNQKKMIDELIKAKEKAEEMNRVKANFFANMSHELRTPFVGILGFAEILAETVTDPEALSMVNSIIKSGKRLTDTLNKILSLSKLEFNEIQPIFQPVKINELLNDTYNLFINSFDKSLINYKLQLLPKELKIKTDEKLLRGILINLINNAIKYTPKGEISVSAKTIMREGKNFLQLVVSDTGIGIPKDKQAVIFEPFRQASEGINRSYEGTGLGLTIVRKYVDLLNGTIKLNSDIGLGTTITIELPFKEITKKETQNKEEEKTEMNNEIIYQQTIAPKKLLYVEDDEVSQSVVTKTLSKYYEIDLAQSAEEALNILKEKTYDALLIDVNLGFGMDGVQLTEKIRTIPQYRDVPIIAVTAYASELDRQEFLSRGFSHYISKPFGIKDLIKLVASVFYTDK
ncbi:MAG: PAS domain S-box protein [Ignavibacteriales bacterium]|nr:PAS domain S-box protein [Ignavibacteriales bacterium]